MSTLCISKTGRGHFCSEDQELQYMKIFLVSFFHEGSAGFEKKVLKYQLVL